MKDPNKTLLRLYDIPDNTFDSDDSEEESEEGKWLEFVGLGLGSEVVGLGADGL